LVDPDKGINSRQKLAETQSLHSLCLKLLQSIPNAGDPQWTSRLYDLPKITFITIYEHLVDQKIMLHKVSYLGPWIKLIAFFKMVMYHPMSEIPDHICVSATVLPSMRKPCV